MAIALTQSRNAITTACNDFYKYWLGNSADSAKTNVSSLLQTGDNLVTIAIIEEHFKKLDEIVALKDTLVQNAKDYTFWYNNYKEAKTAYQNSSSDAYYKLVMDTALSKKTETYNNLLANKSKLDTKMGGVYTKYTSTEPSYLKGEDYVVYGINSGPITLSNKLDLVITDLENAKTALSSSNYNKVTIRCPESFEFDIDIDSVRNNIKSKIDMLINRVKLIQRKFAYHMENIMAFENGETVTINNAGYKTEPVTTEVEKTHVLEKGQTLIYVASLYGVSWQDIARANNITDTRNISAGTVLVIPGQYQTVTGQSDENVEILTNESLPTVEKVEHNLIPNFSTISQTNWDAGVDSMVEGVYDTPIRINSDGKMVDANDDLVDINGYEFLGNGGRHRGIDLSGGTKDSGTPIYTLGPGVVVAYENDYEYNQGCGNYVRVLHETVDEDGNISYIISTYEHLGYIPDNIKVGAAIDSRTMVGVMGNTGNSSGTHLHLEITKVPGLSAEDLEGKTADEVVTIVKENGLKYNYGRDNWIDPTGYFKEQGWIN